MTTARSRIPNAPRFAGRRTHRTSLPKGRPIDYKDSKLLGGFISEYGKIVPSRVTTIPSCFQRKLSIAIKRARFLALLPYTHLHSFPQTKLTKAFVPRTPRTTARGSGLTKQQPVPKRTAGTTR